MINTKGRGSESEDLVQVGQHGVRHLDHLKGRQHQHPQLRNDTNGTRAEGGHGDDGAKEFRIRTTATKEIEGSVTTSHKTRQRPCARRGDEVRATRKTQEKHAHNTHLISQSHSHPRNLGPYRKGSCMAERCPCCSLRMRCTFWLSQLETQGL